MRPTDGHHAGPPPLAVASGWPPHRHSSRNARRWHGSDLGQRPSDGPGLNRRQIKPSIVENRAQRAERRPRGGEFSSRQLAFRIADGLRGVGPMFGNFNLGDGHKKLAQGLVLGRGVIQRAVWQIFPPENVSRGQGPSRSQLRWPNPATWPEESKDPCRGNHRARTGLRVEWWLPPSAP